MFFVHHVHRLRRSNMSEFEATVRDEWMPAIATDDGSRLIWYATSTDAAGYDNEAITIVAVDGVSALERFGERCRTGDLAPIVGKLSRQREGVEQRVLKPLRFNPLKLDLAAVPVDGSTHDTISYMHDFVPPQIGMRRAYEDAMCKVYMAMTDSDLLDIALWAGLEPVAGPIPEEVNISRIQKIDALVGLITKEFPRDNKKLGSWMYDALALRDRWTTRLVRCAPWSPLY